MAMGGGSMIRAAAKATGIGLINSGLRSGVVPEAPISATTRAVSRPIGAIAAKAAASDNVNTAVAVDAQSPETHCSVALDDWEFAGCDEQIISPTGDPRNVFGSPPTIEEAKTATGELKDALEKIFVSSPKSNGSLQDSSHSSQLSHVDGTENKVCLTTAQSAPKHAIQAFRFLDQSPEVQGVVASIASDPNVWEAVLQNPALQGYIRSQTTIYRSAHENIGDSLIQGDVCYQESPRCLEDLSDDEVSSETEKSDDVKTALKDEIQNIWKNIKLGVVDMMTNLSDFFNSLFGVQGDKKDGKSNSDTIPAIVEKILAPSMMGVVVMVIMVVVLKRA